MSVKERSVKPDCMAHFPDGDGYRWLELRDDKGVYGHAAIKERDDALELHLTLARWGPSLKRKMHHDIEWFKKEAVQLKKRRLMGVRADGDGKFDSSLFRFAKLFGFNDFCVLQTMSMDIATDV